MRNFLVGVSVAAIFAGLGAMAFPAADRAVIDLGNVDGFQLAVMLWSVGACVMIVATAFEFIRGKLADTLMNLASAVILLGFTVAWVAAIHASQLTDLSLAMLLGLPFLVSGLVSFISLTAIWKVTVYET